MVSKSSMKTLLLTAFRSLSVLSLIAMTVVGVSQAQAQTEPTEGYVQSIRSLYSDPDAQSDTIGFIEPGEFVRLEHVNALIYRVFRRGESTAAGYVVYPKIGPEAPNQTVTTTYQSTTEPVLAPGGTSTSGDNSDSLVWVHDYVNIRVSPDSKSAVVAQLPPGAAVHAGPTTRGWTLVYKRNETEFEPSRALGYVDGALLKKTELVAPADANRPKTAGERMLAETVASLPQETENKSQSVANSTQGAPDSNTFKVNINSASKRMLESLPGIGPVLADRIIDYRTANGAFARVDDLTRVKGIGDKTLEKLVPYITISE